MLSFTRKAVLELNEMAHKKMINASLLSADEFKFKVIRGNKQTFNDDEARLEGVVFKQAKETFNIEDINLSCGERLLFKKKDHVIGVDNGDMATITAINEKRFTALLDNGKEVVIDKAVYQDFDYGYALTVHKSQGMSIDNAHVIVDSPYWDRFLSFVAMTRHKKALNLYASKEVLETKERLIETLSKAPVKDNVIDYPIDFAIRYGFEPDSIVGRAVTRIVGIKNKVTDALRFITNYSGYLEQKNIRTQFERRSELRKIAGDIANYLDAQQTTFKLKNQIKKAFGSTALAPKDWQESIFNAELLRDKLASKAFNSSSISTRSDIKLTHFKEKHLKADSERYDHYICVKKIIEAYCKNTEVNNSSLKELSNIDLGSMNTKIQLIAKKYGLDDAKAFEVLNNKQEKQKYTLFNELSKDNKDLRKYHELFAKRQTARKFAGQALDKRLAVLANKISKDKILIEKIKQQLPKLAANLKKHLEIDRDRGIER